VNHFALSVETVSDRESANIFLLGAIFNQGQNAEKSWKAPVLLGERLGTLNPFELRALPHLQIREAIATSPSLHRFPRPIADYVISACYHLCAEYNGDARNIWSPKSSASELIARLTKFKGIGDHKASVAAFVLCLEFEVVAFDVQLVDRIRLSCPGLFNTYFPFGFSVSDRKVVK
jgi:endonuclease III